SKSKINIICIEEPENFMHPQMQELFINHIDKAVETILGKRKKSINSQLLITTHSSHILNSKIHASNTFNNINYLTSDDSNMTISVQLNDENIQGVDNNKHDLNFLKKHIKFKVSDLFFSDAIIIVEGITEEQLITSYLTERNKLKKKYISVFNINGAFAHIYIPLIELLKVPCLIVTDLDIKRTSIEKSEYQQVSTIEQRETTNSVIEKYWNNINFLPIKNNTDNVNKKRKKFSSNISYVNMMNLHIVFQKDSIEKYYATSFEEAFILTNYNNDLLNNTLKKIIPKSYKEIITSTENTKNLIINSFKLQRKLSNSKSYFSNTLIHKMANEPYENWPLIPKYIDDGLIWLEEQLSAKLSSEA
ncbi:MAG: putative ATP-dependent endonuclease of OLD family, partial [Arcobacteraceae bacterium]